MSYVLGVDLGTTYSAAAVAAGGSIEIFALGSRVPSIPSVVVLKEDGSTLTGEAADRRAAAEPFRTARGFKRRLGDPTPVLLGGTPYGAEALTALLLQAIVGKVVERRGEPPRLVAITHPANYGQYKLGLLEEAARLAEVGDVAFITEPEAAALHYSSNERLDPGEVVAVYDFGGGTFDAAVLRKTGDGFEALGVPEGMERFGGIDLDDAVFGHVLGSLGDLVEELDSEDPAVKTSLTALRDECRAAKEALSEDTDTTIQVMLPNVHTEVRLTRAEFEDLIRPRLRDTIAAFERAIASAGMEMQDLDRVLLVGGSSRIPLVGEMVRAVSGKPVAVDAHPKHAVALGAASFAESATPVRLGAAPPPPLIGGQPGEELPPDIEAESDPGLDRRGRLAVLAAAVVAVLAFAWVAVAAIVDTEAPEEETSAQQTLAPTESDTPDEDSPATSSASTTVIPGSDRATTTTPTTAATATAAPATATTPQTSSGTPDVVDECVESESGLPVELTLVIGEDGTTDTLLVELTNGFIAHGGDVLHSCTLSRDLGRDTTETFNFSAPLTYCEVTSFALSKLDSPGGIGDADDVLSLAADDVLSLADILLSVDGAEPWVDGVAETLMTTNSLKLEGGYSGRGSYKDRCGVALSSFVTNDCIGYDPATLEIQDLGTTGWRLNAGASALLLYDNETDALRGLAIAGNRTELCFIGRDNTRTDRFRYIREFWHGVSGVTVPIPGPEDCIGYDPATLEIQDLGAAGWRLDAGSSALLLYDNETDALRGLELAEAFNDLCFIGRDNTRPDRLSYIREYWTP